MNSANLNTWQNRLLIRTHLVTADPKPVVDGMPIRGKGEFKADTTYTKFLFQWRLQDA